MWAAVRSRLELATIPQVDWCDRGLTSSNTSVPLLLLRSQSRQHRIVACWVRSPRYNQDLFHIQQIHFCLSLDSNVVVSAVASPGTGCAGCGTIKVHVIENEWIKVTFTFNFTSWDPPLPPIKRYPSVFLIIYLHRKPTLIMSCWYLSWAQPLSPVLSVENSAAVNICVVQ